MKKLNKVTAVAAVLALVLGAGACDVPTDINDNPNAPTDVTPQYILPQLIQSSVSLILGYPHLDMTGVWAGHHAEIQYAEEDVGQIREVTVINRWEAYFSGDLQDAQTIVDKGQASGDANVTAVGMIIRAWVFHAATDLWGDIPYSEALQGMGEEGEEENDTPVYDPQEAVYAGMIANLKAAADMISAGSSPFGQEDLIYGGNMELWRKFANSLRLRLAVRSKNAAAAQSAIADGVFTSNADNAVLNYLSSQPNVNPIFDNFRTRDDHRISATIVDTLKQLDDPRLPVFARPLEAEDVRATGLVYDGMPNGYAAGHPFQFNEKSKLGLYFSLADAPAVLMGYPEVLFLQAEAAERGWIAASAATLYTEGVTASLQMYDGAECVVPGASAAGDVDGTCSITAADIAAYLAQPGVAYNGIESIGVQKWIALFGNGQEAWSEWRRLDFPHQTPGPDHTLGQIPTRYPYPQTEQSLNRENMEAAVARQGGADLTGYVWWDDTRE